jgi:transketolase
MASKETVDRLTELAFDFRLKYLELNNRTGEAIHIGGDLSAADMLVALFNYKLNIDPKNPKMPERDRFILSKGHAGVSLYNVMAQVGYFDFEDLANTYGQVDSAYGMHPCRTRLPMLETSSGSLGHGLGLGVGFALAGKVRDESHRVFVMMGDGETCEGSIWEAAQTAASYGLGNMVGIIDRNRQFMSSYSEDDVKLEPYADKWKGFGWSVIEVADGNDMAQIVDALDSLPETTGATPTAIILHTIKGKGFSFMEGKLNWHSNVINDESYKNGVAEINAARDAWREGRQ